jgi:hypothetical protein
MKKLILLLVLLTFPCFAGDDEQTAGLMNGRFWHGLAPMAKIAFLIGFKEGIAAADNHETFKEYFEPAANYGEITTGVDRLYDQPENAIVPVTWILEVFTMKVRGASQTEIDAKLAAYRKLCIQAQERPKKDKPQKP